MLYSNLWIYPDAYRDTIAYYVMCGLATLQNILATQHIEFLNFTARPVYDIKIREYLYDPGGWYYTKDSIVATKVSYDIMLSDYPQLNEPRPPYPQSFYYAEYFNLMPDIQSVFDLARSYFQGLKYFVYPYSDIDLITFVFLLGINSRINTISGSATAAEIIAATCKKIWMVNSYGFPVVPNFVNVSSVVNKSLNSTNYQPWFASEWQQVFIDIANNYSKWPLCDAFGAYIERQSEIIASGNQQDVLNQSELTTVLQTMKTSVDNEKYRQAEILRVANDAMISELRSAERDFNAMVINAAMIAGING